MNSEMLMRSVRGGLAMGAALAGLFVGAGSSGLACAADEKKADPVTAPVIVLNIAGVDRWKENVDYVFQTVNRSEISKAAEGQLSRVNDLKGMDRTRPFGIMMYLEGLVPRAVGYLPVSNIEELTKTMTLGPITVRKAEGKENRYELVGGRQTLHVKLQNDYGYISDQAEVLDRDLPDPMEAAKSVNSRYDLALTANLDRIPETTRQIFLAALRSSAESQLQQRDNEPRGQYLVRRASGMSNMQMFEQVLTHGKSLTIGWDVSPENKRAVMEFAIDVRPDSDLAQYLSKVGSKPSHFRGLLSDSAPMGFNFSWAFDEARKKSLLEVLKAAKEANDEPAKKPADPNVPEDTTPKPALTKVLDQIISTVETGHIDAFLQMAKTEKGKFVIGGGMKVNDSDAMATAISELVQSLKERKEFKDVTADAEVHKGISLHRLVPAEVRTPERVVYGEDTSVLVGAGSQVAWFSFGGEEAFDSLKRMIDVVTDNIRTTAPQTSSAPFRMVINTERWMSLTGAEEGDRPRPFRDVARQAFTEDNDAVRIDFRPTENGGRLRIEFDEGFLRMIGLGIARQFDRSQL